MAIKHNTENSSIGPNQAHLREVEHPTIDSKNTFEVPFDSIEGYPPDIPIQSIVHPSYTSSPDIPHQDSSSDEELQGVSFDKRLYLIPKTEVNQLHRHT